MTEPIRKSLLPATPPPEWEITTVGGKTGAVVRRRVTFGDWEPVQPDHWADEPATGIRTAARQTTGQDDTDLPARLRATLTERFTELGNPFSEMRIQFKGPDGWPASKPVGPDAVAEVLRELLTAPDLRQLDEAPTTDRSAAKALETLATDLSAARKLLLPADVKAAIAAHRAETLREAATRIDQEGSDQWDLGNQDWGIEDAAKLLRRMAEEDER